MDQVTRRSLLKGGMASLGFLALGDTGLFAAPKGWKPKKKPNLVFGMLTDTHLMTSWDGETVYRTMSLDYIKNAFAHFKECNIDAFVHLGDASHRGQLRTLRYHRDEFDKVFGKKDAPEMLIVAGNHEWQGDWDFLKQLYKDPQVFKENVLAEDFPRLFEKGWGVKYEECWHKEVKGYHFFGRQWGVDDRRFGEFIKSHAESCNLKGTKPFFILSHKMTYWACNSQLREFPNAIGFCGHWHTSLANWGNIYYKRNYELFPYINCGACRYDGENGLDQKWLKEKPDSQRDSVDNHFEFPSRQGLVVSVYDDLAVVMDRREFGKGGRLGPRWVFPFGKFETRPYSRATLEKKIGTPEFRPKAMLDVVMKDTVDSQKNEAGLCIAIPMADGNAKSRVFAYDVVIIGKDPAKRYFKSVYFSAVGDGIGFETDKGVTRVEIPESELPEGKRYTIAVRPISSLGTKGKAIAVTYSTVTKTLKVKRR